MSTERKGLQIQVLQLYRKLCDPDIQQIRQYNNVLQLMGVDELRSEYNELLTDRTTPNVPDPDMTIGSKLGKIETTIQKYNKHELQKLRYELSELRFQMYVYGLDPHKKHTYQLVMKQMLYMSVSELRQDIVECKAVLETMRKRVQTTDEDVHEICENLQRIFS